ncbi:hypothetical protein PLESTB_001940500 [Pleodorina starrii]|uniref:Uncharacterized protein n=1 Tax=Pleodorina starrii TaxID=330485 RepID=A0A9W6C585_9CHLO|nr:hypothetical protein PLESTB_001940500 [Pleodorina starrii]GLC77414.1 hypothetical protein PLESTF_001933000 [Pleodorina starrii]
MTGYQQYHAGEVYASLRKDLGWELLTPHARSTVLRCIDEQGRSAPQQPTAQAHVPDSERFSTWLRRICCDATPATSVIDNGLTCDRAFAGGRLLTYRCRTLVVIGGSAAPAQDAAPHHYWQRGGEDCGEAHGASHFPSAAASGAAAVAPTAWAGELPDHSRVHEATELAPLSCPVRLLLGGNAGGGVAAVAKQPGGARRRARSAAAGMTVCPLPPLEGCAVVPFGGCILVHGGVSPAGEATDEMRALTLRPDPSRPGEYGLYGRVRVQQDTGSGSVDGAGSGVAPQKQAWWLPATVTTNAAAGAAAGTPTPASVSTASSSGSGSGSGGGVGAGPQPPDASRPCPPPSPRHGHHIAVDRATSRLWLFGGRTGSYNSSCGGGTRRSHDAARAAWLGLTAAGHLLPPPSLTVGPDGEEAPADPLPCCYWAQLPTGPDAVDLTAEERTGGDGRGGAHGGGGSSSTDDGAFPGGGVVVGRVSWHCLPLRSSAGAVKGSSGGGPRLPDPMRAAAVSVHDGGLYVLSSGVETASGSGGAGGGGGNRRAAAAAAAQSPSPYRRWWLHRVDLQTGTCVLLCNAVGPQLAAAATVSVSNDCSAPPLYHDDAVAMADDTLPYIYVYGALQRGSGAAALGGGSFAPSLHRVRLGGDGGSGAMWEAVELLGSSRLHAARGALGAASGGAVTLLGGVRNGRRGVEAQLQLVLPATATAGAAKGPTAASRVCAGASAGAGDDPAVATAAGVARCRRVIAEQLRRVAPREVRFAHPSTAPQANENHGGRGGGGGSGGRGPRPCVALAAALSLYSRSGLFDEFFEDLDDGEEERGSPVCNRSSGGGGNASGKGMTLPGHDPLAVAAVVAWVMGRTHIRGDWEPRFLAQMFRVAHCWELVPLQLELVALVARAAPTMRVEQLPVALGLWGELRRLGALAAQAAAAPAGGGGRREGDRVEAVLRSRLHKAAAASSCLVQPDNLEEVMEAALLAAAAEPEGGAGADVCPFVALQGACVQLAVSLLVDGDSGGVGNGSSGSGGCGGGAAAGRAATRFACRFRVWPVLFRAMRWWRRRLATSLRDGGETLEELLLLLRDLKDVQDEDGRRRLPLPHRSVCAAPPTVAPEEEQEEIAFGPTPAKRPRLELDESAAVTAAAGPDSCSGGGGGGRSGGEQRKDSQEKGASEGASGLTGTAAAVGLAGQLCGYLWGELLRNVRPHTALEVLQALVSGPDTTCCEVQQFVQKQAYCKLTTMAPAQRLQLPPSFRTPGHPDFEALREAAAATDKCSSYEERRPLPTQPQQPGLPEGATTTTGAGATSAGGGCGGFGGGGGTPSGAPPLPLPEVVAAALRSGQRLSRQCNEWHQGAGADSGGEGH